MNNAPTFTPSEAAALSGVSTDLQRNWRHRKLIPGRDGSRAAFSLEDVATLYLMNAASVMGAIAEVKEGCAALAKELALYAGSVADGTYRSGAESAGAVMPDGALRVFPSIQAAIAALEEAGAETLRILPMKSIATPFAIRVRAHLRARAQ